MIHIIEVDDSNIKDVMNQILEKIQSQQKVEVANIKSIRPSGMELDEQPLGKELEELFNHILNDEEFYNTLITNHSSKVNSQTEDFDYILKGALSKSLMKKALNEFEIVKNYIKSFDSSDIRWEEKVDINFDEESYLDKFKFLVDDLIFDQFKVLNIYDHDILNQMEHNILPVISERLLLVIEDFKTEFRQYKINEQAFMEEEIRAEATSEANVKELIDNQEDYPNQGVKRINIMESELKRVQIFIPLVKENIILPRFRDELKKLGMHRDIHDWQVEVYLTYYQGADFLITEKDICTTKSEAILKLTQSMGLRQDNIDLRY